MIITVKNGDTLFSISRLYNVPVSKIISDNAVIDEQLVLGQSLIVDEPDKSIYTTQNTDTEAVSSEYGISQRELFRNNYYLKGESFIPKREFTVLSYKNPPTLSKILGGYAYDFISVQRLSSVINYLNYIMPFTYGFTSGGDLIEPNDAYIIEKAKNTGTKALLHLSTLTEEGYFDSTLPVQLFNNETSVQNLINNIISQVEIKGYDGVDVDFEYLPQSEKQNYISFLNSLSQQLHENGKILIVAVPPKTSDEQRGILVEGIDYGDIGSVADYVLTMTYEYGYKFGPPLAIAPVNQVRRVLDYAVSRIDAGKLLLGIPNYGYDWTLPFVSGESDAPSLSTVEAIELAKKYGAEIMYDEESQAPFFFYTDTEKKEHEVWFEDARSYRAKVSLMEEYRLAGGFIWDLMRDNPPGFVTLNSLIDIQ